MKSYMIAALLVLIAGCSSVREYVITKSPDCIYAPNSFVIVEIPNQKLDIKTCLSANFGNPDDVEFAKSLPDEVLNEASKYIESKTEFKSRIRAAREVGDFILIFVTEIDVADGGFEFVYSKKSKKVVGDFTAGYRG